MPDQATLMLFTAAALILVVTPGPAVIYIIARSVDQGRLAGLLSVLGIGIGTLIHVAAAALGLSALLVSSAAVFNLVKYLGAAYLMYLGVRKLMESDQPLDLASTEPQALSSVFVQGIMVNVLNPKVALFILAFLPQFIDTSRGPAATQVLLLGTLLVTVGFLSDGTYALLAGSAGSWLKRNRAFARSQRYIAGGSYIALGLVAAVSGSRQH